jgi:two-component system chemotaxis response regulator CheY
MTTILLVDDSRVSREVIKVFLIGRGGRILEAMDGVEGLRMMHEYHPDLVIADLEMPKLDGLGLCEAVRDDARLRSTPIVVLSGNVTAERAATCRAAGAREVLEKPVQPKALIAAVDRHTAMSHYDHRVHRSDWQSVGRD